ncbi:MAG: choice-of-anchor D domain-containing protein, partial [Candidatus Contendobacter sp.]|nr:choice-of-anchor D domain-containing protein [Candidatus Contendobacter sp.]
MQTVAGDLVLGQEVASQGFYDLSSTGSLNVTGNTIIGSSGMGTFQLRDFTQQTVAGNLVLGDQETGTGTYNLSPTGSLHVNGATYVGNLGTGAFNQTGGVHTTDNELFVGSGSVYNLSNTGVLNTAITYLSSPNSTFNQYNDDSEHNTSYLNIYGGTYNLNAGTINVAGNMGVGHLFNDATFTQTGGHVFVNDPTYGLFVGGENDHIGTYNLNAGTLTVAANTTVGGSGNGTFNNTASGLHEVSGSLIIGDNAGSNGTYNLGGSGQVFVAGNIIIGQNANSTGVLNLNVNSGDAGSIFISPTSQVIIGDAGVGTVNISLDNNFVSANTIVGNQNGSHGTINLSGVGNASVAGQMIVGSQAGSTGVVNLNVNSGDNANITADVIVGDAGKGTINQGGGTFSGTGSETFVLGRSATGQGTYNLMGGTLNDSLIVGDAGGGEFNNSGGIHNVAGDLVLGNQTTGNGAYNLSSTGSLNVTGNTIIGSEGQGTFEQTGGTQTVTGGVTIAANPGSGGIYNLSGGALDAGTMTVNVDGALNYSGGALTLGGGTGTLTNNGGQVILSDAGTRTITGNVSNTGTFNSATNANVTGTFTNNSGGTLTVNAPMAVGSLVQNSATAGSITLNSDITVATAYQNAGFGSGNSFNNHANMSGSGQVLSSNANAATQQQISVNGGPATPNDVVITLNAHVGSSISQNYTINNLAGGPSLTGAIQTTANGGNITDNRLSGSGVTAGNWNAAAGGSTSPLGVTFNATSAGALTDQVVHVTNNFDNTNSQNITIQGAGYNLATASVSPAPVTLGNQRVGGTATQALTVANTAPVNATYTETLSANVGGNTDNATHNGGTISGLAGGASNSTALQVGVDTSTAGARTGTVTVNLTSNEVNGSGLGNTALAPQVITVSGNVYQVAQPSLPTTVNLGNVHVGGNLSQAITINNTLNAPAGFQEGLNVAVGSTSGGATGSGSITNLAAGDASSAVSVGLSGIGAGAQSGSVTLNLTSNGVGTSGLADLALPSQAVTVNATGYNLATANVTPLVTLQNQRVGGVATQALTVANTAPVNATYTETLSANVGGGNTGNATHNSGGIS